MKINFAEDTFYNKNINITLTGEQFAYLVAAVGASNYHAVSETIKEFGLPASSLDDCTFWEELRDTLCDLAGVSFLE